MAEISEVVGDANGVAQVEGLDFEMHRELLVHVIKQQAGTVYKAVQEGVQNSVDAGATRIDVEVTAERISIIDNGRGIRTMEEFNEFFRKFGTPHEEGDAVFGRYRIGRGQMFCFGRNIWRTTQFSIEVDIENPQMGFKCYPTTGLEHFPGCRIDIHLYNSLTPYEQYNIQREVGKYIKYISVPVLFNGVQINTPPEEVRWTMETDEAYVSLKESGRMVVYNLGALVGEFPPHNFNGQGGIIVSKRALNVNMARNTIIQSCPVWKAILAKVGTKTDRAVRRKLKLNDNERRAVIARLVAGELDANEVYQNAHPERHGGQDLFPRHDAQDENPAVVVRGSGERQGGRAHGVGHLSRVRPRVA